MHTTLAAGGAAARQAERGGGADGTAASAVARIAIAGATGYTGQELLRLLARHPAAQIVAATSSGVGPARAMPALARIWNGSITPLDADALARDADLIFLAL